MNLSLRGYWKMQDKVRPGMVGAIADPGINSSRFLNFSGVAS